ncbi:hypothetical protein BDV24DRAFT_121737 [Aspergillus arachidicola]|uniref:Uncharacterized protein n=1 Tax=Aspergillus arachidicola TaxID=656916 RepID=A0A5N6YWC0_9EURO|nr:hypothetical protein BDV24DRAFT_121737 [Aspergillus arachidicola]
MTSRDFPVRLLNIILACASGKMHRDGVLATFCLNQRWWSLAEEVGILGEVGNSQSGRHDHEF